MSILLVTPNNMSILNIFIVVFREQWCAVLWLFNKDAIELISIVLLLFETGSFYIACTSQKPTAQLVSNLLPSSICLQSEGIKDTQ